ncbi:uncharacterized protein zgc:113184 isoform X1 [Gymnodraco acuticeps]|uniref:Uncharacterized protein zgc:113184 isoform X1 n=1 Tax=Gymnodraco acuticeps TaxID=8218 RepID=A0A6P8STA6_GYMAC|nr:uncharacterized protein zgc:113184 isoform X1 [Gymnodraco acuticeps]XP_034054080.1 uncharacterized protein zgc:113184 isoform X1 [Gymnodraco acuticeps]XP_034054081.1 uncharacterized protein zgc:113184 isoform X1 [Gymnodraco acuticeps]XP_034054082.1 uncharacterized protein zgc:113184 isoform X1 [Gymnodraco acuticeps]XP_034054083.1 uncharacterized protein zgc:113184 isoform X1 [Gymnodraco acuticeps]XP_034054084.1 uncharacterized protein zgc:113184 isoform X1 [Gymnodraco acuticeps]XP_03405408
MEEAYSELYQQFLHLRSLCLRQAALLHQLTTALQKQQGATVPNGELIDLMSIPVQCTQEIPVYFHEKRQTSKSCNPAAHCGVVGLSKNVGTFYDVLAEDISKLNVDVPHQTGKADGKSEQMVAPLSSFDIPRLQGACPHVSNDAGHTDNRIGDRTMHTVGVGLFSGQQSHLYWPRVLKPGIGFLACSSSKMSISCPLCLCQMPATGGPSLFGDMLMSDVVLQSHVCEFCQAVFPGDTATRGEFLRHLYTHVT